MNDADHAHPAFPQPENPAVHLWRYMNAPKFEWFVAHNRLFMPGATHLGDPLEGTVPDGECAWWERQAANANSDEQRRIIEHNRNFIAQFAKAFRQRHYYVSCWHMNQYENHEMWRCYTTQADSVAIRTSYQTLRNLLPNFVYMGLVRYIDYTTTRLPTWNLFEYIMHKDDRYAFEQEVRAVASSPAVPELGAEEFEADLFESEDRPGLIVYAPSLDVAALIERVFLHPEASAAFEADIAELCAQNGLPSPERSRGAHLGVS